MKKKLIFNLVGENKLKEESLNIFEGLVYNGRS